jgi:hypothetical protein
VGTGSFTIDTESPAIACDPGGNHVYLTFVEMDLLGSPPIGKHFVQFARSTDGGVTFEPRVIMSGEFAGDPRLTVGPDGEVYLLWHDYASGQVLLRKSADSGLSFSAPTPVGTMRDNIGAVSTRWASDFNRRNPYYYMKSGDMMPNAPSVTVDRSDGPGRGSVYAVWSEYADGSLPLPAPVNEIEPNEFYAQAMPLALGQVVSGVAVDPGKLDPGD